MKIVFICGSLMPGSDGVGDYTIKLAVQLKRLGHDACALALNDRFIKKNIAEVQHFDGITLSVLRLASSLPLKTRFNEAKKWLKKISPEWISIQYVPYSFDTNGMPLYLANFLDKLKTDNKWHTMIHEPFLDKQKSFKNIIIRYLQKRSIKLIYKKLKPATVHTSIPLYQKMLMEIPIESKLLGLFGNLRVPDSVSIAGKEVSITEKRKFICVYFGTAPKVQYHDIFTNKIKAFCREHQLHLIICGNSGKNGKTFANSIEAACKEEFFEMTFLGELKPWELSELFLKADFGIARVSTDLLGKSGSAISMLEHGLPLWVPLVKESQPSHNQFDFRSHLCFYELADVLKIKEKYKSIDRLPEIANKFLADLD
ncbi:MAG: hypothetical protein ABJA90_03820 [Ginsengibacter sp.]